jgi:hypothetical protein
VITFILAMVQNPAVQKRAQEEVDRVLSGTRLPQVEDLQDLPYLMAIIKECLRWKPILPLSEWSRYIDIRSMLTQSCVKVYLVDYGKLMCIKVCTEAFTTPLSC